MDWREIVVIVVAIALAALALATPFVRKARSKKGKGSGCCSGACGDCKYGGCPYCGTNRTNNASHESDKAQNK